MKPAKLVPFFIGAGCLAAGIAVMLGLILIRKPPAQARGEEEKALSVEAIRVMPVNETPTLVGYGEVRTIKEVPIAAEVAGKVIETYSELEPGTRIPAGETILVIDPRQYEAQLEESRAAAGQARRSLSRMRAEAGNEQKRLAAAERNRDLAEDQYERLRELVRESVGTQAEVDRAEQAYVQARDEADRLADTVDLYPLRINEMEENLAAAEARVRMAEINLEKTQIVAPFDARVKQVNLEVGQFLSPGTDILTLADDSVLELQVKLPSREVHDWLQFNGDRPEQEAWFGGLKKVACTIQWTEAPEARSWEGTLERVEALDQEARTITAAIRVTTDQALANGFPLVEGMFCKVTIPGRPLENVFRVPTGAITLDDSVYVARDNRLHSIPVTIARTEGNATYVSDGLGDGDLVIVTRLVNPLDNTLLDVALRDAEEDIES